MEEKEKWNRSNELERSRTRYRMVVRKRLGGMACAATYDVQACDTTEGHV